MIQVEERKGLGDGQRIETEMAKQVGLKVFRTYTNSDRFSKKDFTPISIAVKEWYRSGCSNRGLQNIFVGDKNTLYRARPWYQEL